MTWKSRRGICIISVLEKFGLCLATEQPITTDLNSATEEMIIKVNRKVKRDESYTVGWTDYPPLSKHCEG